MEPLTDLLKKEAEFVWAESQNDAYLKLKQLLMEGTATAYPDFEKEFIVKPDGSPTTVGAVLTQNDERGKEVMVAAASQKLNEAEKAWAPYDKEMFAIIWAVRQFSHYLKFKPFTIVTDHKPLLSCLKIDPKKDATGKRTRWALELSTYEFNIKHKPGKLHTDADALSRAPHASAAEPPPKEEEIIVLGACCPSEVPLAEFNALEQEKDRMKDAQSADGDMRKVIEILQKRPRDPATELKKENVHLWYCQNAPLLHVMDGLLYQTKIVNNERQVRVIIPESKV